jgi:hypothetical protein
VINLILINLIHFVSDFLCQTREMATNKSKSLYWLTLHVLVYSTATIIGWCYFTTDIHVLGSIWVITFLTHWLTDFTTSKITTYYYLKNNMFGFFSTIGFDQLIHSTTLLITYYYFIKQI